MDEVQEYINNLIDDFERFWEGWEFAKESNRPDLFTRVHEALSDYHELLLKNGSKDE